MDRALREFRIRGVKTNIAFLENLINHPTFLRRRATPRSSSTRRPSCSSFTHAARPRHQAADLHRRRDRQRQSRRSRAAPSPTDLPSPRCPAASDRRPPPDGTRQLLRAARPREVRALDARAEAAAADRHDVARRPPVAAGHAHAHARHAARSPTPIARAPAAAVLAGDAGAGRPSTSRCASCRRTPGSGCRSCARRCRTSCFQMLLRASNAVGYTNYPDNVVRHFVTQAAEARHRRVPRLRLPQLGRRTCASRWMRCSRRARSARRPSATPATSSIPTRAEVRPRTTTCSWPRNSKAAGAHILGHQGHGRPAASRTPRARWSRRCARRSASRSTSTRTTPRGISAGVGPEGGRGRASTWSTRAMDAVSRPHLAAQPQLDRRGAARHRRATPGSTPRVAGRTTRCYWEAVREHYAAFESGHDAPARRKSTSTRCRAASSPTSRSRPARWAWRRAGTRWRRPMPTSTGCSATSSR